MSKLNLGNIQVIFPNFQNLQHVLQKYLKDNKQNSLHLAQTMHRYLCLDIICSSKLSFPGFSFVVNKHPSIMIIFCAKLRLLFIYLQHIGTSRHNKYGLLPKCEVKMAGYWPSFFCMFVD